MSVTREEALEKLLSHYDDPYQVVRCAPSDFPLVATASMHLVSERKLLSLASAGIVESDDFVYIYSAEELTLSLYEECCASALQDGFARVDPNPNHNFSLISLIFLCDRISPDAAAALKKNKLHKVYVKPEAGWVDLRLAAVSVGSRSHAANGLGKALLKIYKDTVK